MLSAHFGYPSANTTVNYECPVCKTVLKGFENYKAHFDLLHNDIKNICRTCYVCFTNENTLKEHVQELELLRSVKIYEKDGNVISGTNYKESDELSIAGEETISTTAISEPDNILTEVMIPDHNYTELVEEQEAESDDNVLGEFIIMNPKTPMTVRNKKVLKVIKMLPKSPSRNLNTSAVTKNKMDLPVVRMSGMTTRKTDTPVKSSVSTFKMNVTPMSRKTPATPMTRITSVTPMTRATPVTSMTRGTVVTPMSRAKSFTPKTSITPESPLAAPTPGKTKKKSQKKSKLKTKKTKRRKTSDPISEEPDTSAISEASVEADEIIVPDSNEIANQINVQVPSKISNILAKSSETTNKNIPITVRTEIPTTKYQTLDKNIRYSILNPSKLIPMRVVGSRLPAVGSNEIHILDEVNVVDEAIEQAENQITLQKAMEANKLQQDTLNLQQQIDIITGEPTPEPGMESVATVISKSNLYDFVGVAVPEIPKKPLSEAPTVIHTSRRKPSYNFTASPRMFACDQCPARYNSRCTLNFHKRYHSGNLLVCEFCLKTFVDKTTFTIHKRSHTKEKPFGCDLCAKFFVNKQSLREHLLRHNPNVIKCGKCFKVFTTEAKLQTHMAGIHSVENKERPRNFKCSECSQTFTSSTLARDHVIRKHIKNNKILKCDLCEYTFAVKKDLLSHRKRHFLPAERPKTHFCPQCNRAYFSKHSVKLHILRKHTENPQSCRICYRLFETEEKLIEHVINHPVKSKQTKADMLKKNHICPFCDKAFQTAQNKRLHMARKHTKLRPWKCSACEKAFYLRCELFNHRKNDHDKKELKGTHKCNICDKIFYGPITLKFHNQRMHSTERPYKCEKCDKAWACNADLSAHNKVWHGTIEKKKYICNHCNKTYFKKDVAEKHMEKCKMLSKFYKFLEIGQEAEMSLMSEMSADMESYDGYDTDTDIEYMEAKAELIQNKGLLEQDVNFEIQTIQRSTSVTSLSSTIKLDQIPLRQTVTSLKNTPKLSVVRQQPIINRIAASPATNTAPLIRQAKAIPSISQQQKRILVKPNIQMIAKTSPTTAPFRIQQANPIPSTSQQHVQAHQQKIIFVKPVAAKELPATITSANVKPISVQTMSNSSPARSSIRLLNASKIQTIMIEPKQQMSKK